MKPYPGLLLVGFLALPLGCTMTPKYARPAPPVPSSWPSGPAYSNAAVATAVTNFEPPPWREFFPDPKLQKLIAIALENNRDLRLAALNVERAQALYGIQRAELLPTVNATGSGYRGRLPADLSGKGKAETRSQYSVGLGVAAWEIDFFGRIRSLKERALQEYLASQQAQRSAEIVVVSAVANAYLALAADREAMALAQTTLEAQRSTYDLIKRRYQLGLIPELDVHRAQTQVDAARRDVAGFTQAVAQDQNALTLLTGSPIDTDLLPVQLGKVAPPRDIAAGLPSDVLLQRPDVLESENMLKAAYADIGAARAAFFPRISLTAAIGTASSDLTGLFKSGSGTWSYAPQIVMPIFDARTWSALKASKLQQQIAVTQYERSIQNAFREVADALALRGTVGQQVAAEESYVNAVAATFRLATSRYEKGIDSYLSVLDAQRSLYFAQQALLFLKQQQLASQIRLYSVLGGGAEPKQVAKAAEPRQRQAR